MKSKLRPMRGRVVLLFYCRLIASLTEKIYSIANFFLCCLLSVLGSREVTLDVCCSRGSRGFERENRRAYGSHQSTGGREHDSEGERQSRDAFTSHGGYHDCRLASGAAGSNIASSASKFASPHFNFAGVSCCERSKSAAAVGEPSTAESRDDILDRWAFRTFKEILGYVRSGPRWCFLTAVCYKN